MTGKKQSWKDVKKVISKWSDKQLAGLVQDLYNLNLENAAFLNARLLHEFDPEQILAPYKNRIQRVAVETGSSLHLFFAIG